MPPTGFSWVDEPHLAAMAAPGSAADLAWLRRHKVEVLISLTEDPLPKRWVDDAGIMVVNVPVPDMEPPSDRQLEYLLDTIKKANAAGMGVGVHCGAGMGRTGTVLAVYFVALGVPAQRAIDRVRDLRPGSIETTEQERAVERFAARAARRAGG
ncbi:dual specificity protein phosphatase : Uncharacterized protein OS=Candidatus Kuenenia stuttgartiensis GN=kuste2994 PE=4 SV=1: DSPc [Gemmataceae bacterium]|nr:dual specificity protein phosphatase : Uncharacterized protein OS=Candidatus Kuenenia stuttgartiensis GN=kuste2994 PE=4 SV=1: DSPc [Gemmataceae bacterium]VTU00698.1 dual specificity protein phosphatase : Uncharacterized protein OS=Candidatus Kuenenia stuttgartiensis GN=kuste2994 PE=4 SV=1: DSPc [Gemmataceae bacterium]